ncbi:ABC transporter permease [Mesobacillus selenatarsenatis]|uniref:Unspecified monosaccharide ABC transport system, permease component Ia (FIG025991)/unspecified monosaccharide ABC transport system, permease component Ib (FIG143636) n=1 Tax=Mesobacillus selenatarsenatis (strain DSM 18680 / JCM 14380 / FERM P-15431 / SF-1) TaxID=1321606 RepID=A0A0A8X6V7_MESS1|nr:ABC transporter permease [Mesobacillus selenatarsenatis]GAM14989.1 unspecified monosaccharide ABC transport system, permease component Ia (FIG025991)/unspecified monosaccharide ABC transport system, permease component Ib (FIG143636) [Mesobacillus selenatarsenatis SF-1]
MRNTIVSLISIILGLVAGGILMLFIGSNPIEGYSYLLQGALKNLERIGNTLATATPLIFTGLSVAFAFRTGLFNIGASGQMLVGGLAATAVALTFDLSRPILLLVMVLAGLVAGALWAFIPGLLKAKFNVHEVVSTIMMNWIAYWTIYYIVPGYFKGEFLETESKKLAESDTLRTPFLTEMFDGSYINLGLFLAVIAVIIIAFIIEKTTLGFELKAVGFNRFAAEYAGMKVNRNIILSMLISGALAGVGGVALYTGNASSIQIGILPAQGYDGIAVALLGANHPVGVFFAAVLFGILYSGTGFMNAMTEIPPELANTIIAIIIYFAATSVMIERLLNKFKAKKSNKEDKSGPVVEKGDS